MNTTTWENDLDYPGGTTMDTHTGYPQELDPSLEGGCDQDGGRPDIPTQTRHQGQKLGRSQYDHRHLI